MQALGIDLSLTHTTATTFVELGGTYVLRITVKNAGPAIATNGRVTERLLNGANINGLRYWSGPASCSISAAATETGRPHRSRRVRVRRSTSR